MTHFPKYLYYLMCKWLGIEMWSSWLPSYLLIFFSIFGLIGDPDTDEITNLLK